MDDHDVHRTQQHGEHSSDDLLLLPADCPFPESSSDLDKEEHQVLHLHDFSPRDNYGLQRFSEDCVRDPGVLGCPNNELHGAGRMATSAAERRRMEGAHGTLLCQRLKIVTNQRIGRGKDLTLTVIAAFAESCVCLKFAWDANASDLQHCTHSWSFTGFVFFFFYKCEQENEMEMSGKMEPVVPVTQMGIRVLKNKHTFEGKANAAQSPTRGRMKMDIAQLFGVNLPMAIVNVLANVFFMFCLVRPSQGEPLKQPLKLLLWTVICSTLSFLVSLLVLFHWVTDSIVAHFSSYGMFVLSLSVSMSTSVWLNFFYHMQIVPSKNTIFVWIKKNLKPIIYCIWVVDKLIIGLTVSSILTIIFFIINNLNDLQLAEQLNYNYSNSINSYALLPSHLVNLRFSVIAIQIYFIICLCIVSACPACPPPST